MNMKNVTVNFTDDIVAAIEDKNVDIDRRANLWGTIMYRSNVDYKKADKSKMNIGCKYDFSIGYVLLCNLISECGPDDEIPGIALMNALDCWHFYQRSAKTEEEAIDEMCLEFYADCGLFESTRIFGYTNGYAEKKEESNNGKQ